MFLYFYRESAGITPALLQRVIQASPTYGERCCRLTAAGARDAERCAAESLLFLEKLVEAGLAKAG